MSQSLSLQDPRQDPSGSAGTLPDGVDRRYLLRYLGAGMAALAVPGALAAVDVKPLSAAAEPTPCNPLGLPYHLSILDPKYPHALVPHAHKLALLGTSGKTNRIVGAIDDLVKKNKAFFQKSPIVKELSKRVKSGKTPKTVQEMFSLFETSWTGPSVCIVGPEHCIDTGCDDACWAGGKYPGGQCYPAPAGIFEEECICACNPGFLEFTLLALLILLLLATPGPDEIPVLLAAVSRLIIRRAPVPVP